MSAIKLDDSSLHTSVFGNQDWRNRSYSLASMIALSLIKIVLISNHEIVAVLRPHDDYWHIQAAAAWVWGRPFNEWTLIQLPIYALFVAVSGATGMPLRISTELAYLAGAALLSLSLGRLGLGRVLQINVFALLAFHPFTFEGFDFALAEMLYSCLMIFFVAFFIRIIAPTSGVDLRLNTVLFAVTSALLWYCRKESILIGGLFGLIAIGIVAGVVVKALKRCEAIWHLARLVAAPAAAIIILGAALSAANGLAYGFWHTNILTAPNYVRAYSSLLEIKPDHPIRFVPVTKSVREEAYQVSPAFREMQPILDGEQEHWTETVTRNLMGIRGQIGAGWFYWALLDGAAGSGHLKTPTEAEEFYGRIADEIGTALKAGRLPARHAWLPFVDPDFSLWLPDLPRSIATLAASLFPSNPPRYPERPAVAPPEVVAAFDRVANRRTSQSMPSEYAAQGWLISSGFQPIEIQVVGEDGQATPSRFQAVPRPDVKPIADQTGKAGPPSLGFNIRWFSDEKGLGSLHFKVLMEGNHSVISEPISNVPLGRGVQISDRDANSTVFLALDRLDKPVSSKRESIAKFVTVWYPACLAAFAAVSLAYLIYAALARSLILGPQLIAFLFVLATISSRVVFFAVLDASAWSAEQTRYLLCVALLVPVLSAIALTRMISDRETGLR